MSGRTPAVKTLTYRGVGMNWGDFRTHFKGVAWKRLTNHEVDPRVSNGHEFQGVNALRDILGTAAAERLPATYMLLRDDVDNVEVLRLWAKWYDSRANNPERSAEWRLYYPAAASAIQAQMRAGDLMVIAVRKTGELVIMLARAESNRERELQVLFDIGHESTQLNVRAYDAPLPMDFLTSSILEELGLGRDDASSRGGVVESLILELVDTHPDQLPPGQSIAALVRTRLPNVDAVADPDNALFSWIETEAALYRGWEDQKIQRRLQVGFGEPGGNMDVEGFRQFSMSLRQSRVSRAGGALQYHFRALLDAARLSYVMEPEVDLGEVPDFIFPSLAAYNDVRFPQERLRMLAAKFTAKDRWRQVLSEAHRIPDKHLLTLEVGVSRKQMLLMNAAALTLVMPEAVRTRYSPLQSKQILSVGAFIRELRELQGA
jgi:hypothetical protein